MSQSASTLYERLGSHAGLCQFLHHFYADVRQHELIGPIFESKIQDWPAHIEKIAGFWSGLTGGPSVYGGGFAWKHMSLGLEDRHFRAWLGLWEQNCRAHLEETEAEQMVNLAHNIGARLKLMIAQANQANGRSESDSG